MSDAAPNRGFHRTFSRRALRSFAGQHAYERGLRYADGSQVRIVSTTASSAVATVVGSSPYRVRLWIEDDEPAHECDCPVGTSGQFCKHVVAAALLVTGAAGEGETADQPVDVRAYLASLDQDVLADLVLDRARHDELFAARLQMDAARTIDAAPNIATFRHVIDDAFVVDDYVDYREMYASRATSTPSSTRCATSWPAAKLRP